MHIKQPSDHPIMLEEFEAQLFALQEKDHDEPVELRKILADVGTFSGLHKQHERIHLLHTVQRLGICMVDMKIAERKEIFSEDNGGEHVDLARVINKLKSLEPDQLIMMEHIQQLNHSIEEFEDGVKKLDILIKMRGMSLRQAERSAFEAEVVELRARLITHPLWKKAFPATS